MNQPQDHFSSLARAYVRGRIRYPEELFRFWRPMSSHSQKTSLSDPAENGSIG